MNSCLGPIALAGFLIALGSLCHVEARDIYSDVRFYYDPQSHLFVAVTITKCYLVALTHVERDHIHSRGAMEDVEMNFMRNWLGILNETRVYMDDQSLSANIRSWCVNHAHDIFKLERVIKDSTNTLHGLVG